MLSSIIGIAFDCPDANELADFYVKLSGWKKEISSVEWAGIRTPEGVLLVFQTVLSIDYSTVVLTPYDKHTG